MLKKLLRRPVLLFAVIALAMLIPAFSFFHMGHLTNARAAGKQVLPNIVTPASISNGKPFQLHVRGFKPLEQIQISWSGNKGQQLGILHTDELGEAFNCIRNVATYFDCLVPPPTPAGTYVLTATGVTSKLHISTTIKVVAGIVFSPDTAGPGSVLQIIGAGFPALTNLLLYFQSPAYGTTAVQTDASGFFVQTLLTPKTYDAQASYFVHVANAQKVDIVKEPFSFTAPSLTSSLPTVTHGVPVAISGAGFLAQEVVDVYWDYQHADQLLVGTVTANPLGSFSLPITTPDITETGIIPLVAIGRSSALQATSTVEQRNALVLSPSRALPGSKVQINGGGFAPDEKITLSSQNVTLAILASDANGAFSADYRLPAILPSGVWQVQAVGAKSGTTLSAQFTVLPSLMLLPAAGASSDTIIVTGQNYTKNSHVDIFWSGSSPLPTTPTVSSSTTSKSKSVTITVRTAHFTSRSVTVKLRPFAVNSVTPTPSPLISVPTDGLGNFSAKIIVPPGAVDGDSYIVQVRDEATQIQVGSPFSVQ